MTAEPILLLTRPSAASLRFGADVVDLVGRPVPRILSPLLGIVPLGVSLPAQIGGLVLTSAQGAEAAARLGVAAGTPAWCVGDRTAEAATEGGFDAASAGGDADALYARLIGAAPPLPLLHLRGRHSRGDLAARLTAAGLETVERVAYDQIAVPPTPEAQAALAGTAPVVVPLFSPRTAEIFADAGPFAASIHAICISRAAAEALSGLICAQCVIADRPDGAAMAALTCATLVATMDGHGAA
ncbi:uroporphyrinogen-III synthase [Roseisalinus antarcticus]|uniref:Uroporphyrinogen-III synthase n=1 Tax=Roseisalinus antarcticus TaxID=254357 RepID=A0A1Y5S1K3_9RHOB|nr:uroporphyrinogen-III synthase [Roseisalinus antarcticus]SLN30384.1 uroporphyrinogen-III synthase [Roseisalinus antarcticus]